MSSHYYSYYAPHRGELTLQKVITRIKGVSSLSTKSDLFKYIYPTAYREIKEFESPQELMDNIYWHGSGTGVSGGLRPGAFLQHVKQGQGGGGYGELYHSISLSKSKNMASDFTGASHWGTVYPVLLRHGAECVTMPEISDSEEIEDKIVELWLKKVDAIKIGNWDSKFSEQELVVLNPRCILKFQGEGFGVYHKQRFDNPDLGVYTAIFNTIQNGKAPTKDIPLEVDYSLKLGESIRAYLLGL